MEVFSSVLWHKCDISQKKKKVEQGLGSIHSMLQAKMEADEGPVMTFKIKNDKVE